MIRKAAVAMCSLVGGIASLTTPAAANGPEGATAQFIMLTDAEMAEARGGFQFGGMSVSFGADMQTFLNGELALHTIVSWTPTGPITQTTVGNMLSQDNVQALQANGPAGLSIPANLAGSHVYTANNGQTAIVQGANAGLQNVLLNSANNLNAIQTTNATLSLGNYGAFAAAMRTGVMAGTLGREVGTFSH